MWRSEYFMQQMLTYRGKKTPAHEYTCTDLEPGNEKTAEHCIPTQYVKSRFASCILQKDLDSLNRIIKKFKIAFPPIPIHIYSEPCKKRNFDGTKLDVTMWMLYAKDVATNLLEIKHAVFTCFEHGFMDLDMNFMRTNNNWSKEEEKEYTRNLLSEVKTSKVETDFDNYRIHPNIGAFPADISYKQLIHVRPVMSLQDKNLAWNCICQINSKIVTDEDLIVCVSHIDNIIDDDYSKQAFRTFLGWLQLQIPERKPMSVQAESPSTIMFNTSNDSSPPPPMMFKRKM